MDGAELYGRDSWADISAATIACGVPRPSSILARLHRLPSLADFPVPKDVPMLEGWTEQMREMAAHIGSRSVIILCDTCGGSQFYISRDGKQSPFAGILPTLHLYIIAHVYGQTRILLPRARSAVARAKRAGLIAAVRAKMISGGDAAIILNTSRTYVSHLVNDTDEGCGIEPSPLPKRRDVTLLERAGSAVAAALKAASVDDRVIGAAVSSVLAIDKDFVAPPPIFPSDTPPALPAPGIPSPHPIPNED